MSVKWASYRRVREAAEELKAMIREKYPDTTFKLVRAPDQQRSWHLLAIADVEDADEVGDMVRDREIDMLVEEHIPLHVIPLERGRVRSASHVKGDGHQN